MNDVARLPLFFFFFLSFFLLPLFQRFTPTRRSIENRRWLVFGAAALIEELARFSDLRLHERSQPLWKALWDKYFISRPPSAWKCRKWDWWKSGKQTQPYLILGCCMLFIFYFFVSEPSVFLTLICCAREGKKKIKILIICFAFIIIIFFFSLQKHFYSCL